MKNKFGICVLVFGSLFAFVFGTVLLSLPSNSQDTKNNIQAASSQRDHVVYDISQDGTGNGLTAGTPRLIGSLRTLTASLPTSSSSTMKYFVLISDIDLSGVANWSVYTTTGTSGATVINRYLASGGIFDGNNYSIIGLTINQNTSNRGFFHTVSGTVKDLYFEDVSINETVTTKPSTVGVVASATSGTAVFNNVHIENGTVVGASTMGGIVGSVAGTVTFTGCSNAAEVKGTGNTIGGIAGAVAGAVTIIGCTNNGVASGQSNVGGMIGSVTSTVNMTGCNNYAEITGANQTTSNVGGMIGSASSSAVCTITGCFNSGVIIGQMNAGGILGSKTSTPTTATTITRCANEGSISVSIAPTGSNTTGGGGIVGNISGGTSSTNKIEISWCYSRGGIASGNKAPYLSGILGRLHQGTAVIEKCFSDVEIATGGTPKTGIAGVSGGSITIKSCYYNNSDADVSVCNSSYTNGGTTSEGKTGAFIGSQKFVDLLNIGQNSPIYVMINGQVKLREFNKSKIFMFKDTSTDKVVYKYATADFDGVLQFDDYVDLGFKKTGYTFIGWKEEMWTSAGWQPNGDAAYPEGADSYPNTYDKFSAEGKDYVTFVAVYELTVFTVEFVDNEDNNLSISQSTFTIENFAGVRLTAATFVPEVNYWRIKLAGRDGGHDFNWETLGSLDIVMLDTLISEVFIDKYAEYHSGSAAAYFTIKIVTIGDGDLLTSVLAEVNSGMTNAGSLYINIEGEQEVRAAPFGSYFVFAGDKIAMLQIKQNDYFQFIKCELFGEDSSLGFINAAGFSKGSDSYYYYTSKDSRFNNAITKIKVYFEKKQYDFTVMAAEKGKEAFAFVPNVVGLQADGQSFSLGDLADITLYAAKESRDQRYIFRAWKIQSASGYYAYVSSELQYNGFVYAEVADVDWLLKHLVNDKEVIIIAEYIKQYDVVIAISQGSEQFGKLIFTVVNSVSGNEQVPNDFYSGKLPEGSWISVQAHANEYYEFEKFVRCNSGEEAQPGTLVIQITSDRDIEAVFNYKSYKIVYEFIDTFGKPIRNVSGVPNNQYVRINEVLAEPEFILNIYGHKFVEYQIIDKHTDNVIEDAFGRVITMELLEKVFSRGNSFVIKAVYKKFYALSFVIDGTVSENDYKVTVYDKATDQEITYSEFEYGKEVRIEIKLLSAKYFTVGSILGTYGDDEDAYVIDDSTKAIDIFMEAQRKITICFKAIQVNFEKKLTAKGNGDFNIDRTAGLKVGQQITLIAEPGSMQEIKKWKVNGITVGTKNLPSNFERIGNNLVITITSEWLEQLRYDEASDKFIIDSTIEFGLESTIATIAICSGSAIILLTVSTLLYIINVRRNNSRIKQKLIVMNRLAATMGAGGFIADLREGKDVGNVTAESIKEAKKQEKIQRREERQKKREEK